MCLEKNNEGEFDVHKWCEKEREHKDTQKDGGVLYPHVPDFIHQLLSLNLSLQGVL